MHINNRLHTILVFSICLLICSPFIPHVYGQRTNAVPVSPKNTQGADSVKNMVKKDTAQTAKVQTSSQFDAEISYSASDSIELFVNSGTSFLYGNAEIKYKDMHLTDAGFVRVKMDSAMIYAEGTVDSTGVMAGKPIFKDKESEYTSNKIIYNFRSKKGYVHQAVTQQGEGYIISDRTKIIDNDIINMEGGKYTTCDAHDHPHFYLQLSKAKVKPGSFGVAGRSHLVLLDVPFPVILPFAYFPFSTKYSSGIEMPSFDTNSVFGYGLTNGGYYFAINDYVDVDVRGDVYTRGTWGVNITSTYRKRYKFTGGVSINYREDVSSDKDLPDYSKRKNLSIRWSHTQDQKVNPFRTFSASVNFATSGYNKSNINNYYTPANADVTKSSSISYSRRFPNNPFSITANFDITQNMRDTSISLTLPNLAISMSRIYPLKRKIRVGNERWYEKISMSYSGNITNSIRRNENLILKTPLSDWDNRAEHRIPISASFNLFDVITISPSVNYSERWFLKSKNESWDEKNQKVNTVEKTGFKRVYDFNFNVSANTTIYGIYTPNRKLFGEKIIAIRHKLEPSVGFGYNPDFTNPHFGYMGTYDRTYADAKDPAVLYSQMVLYSHFKNYSPPSKSGSMFFSFNNNLEMKVKKSDNDTTDTKSTKIVSLIDQFSLSGGYNFIADSMRWNNFNTTLRLKLSKSYSLSLSAAFDPYMNGLGADGKSVRRINQLRWNHGKFPRFLGTSASYSYTFSNDTFKKKSGKKDDNKHGDQNEKGAFDSDPNNPQSENSLSLTNKGTNNNIEKTDVDADGYEKIEIPWSLTVSYSVRYQDNTSAFDYSKMEYKRKFMQNLSLSGSLKFTPGWMISATSSYDFEFKKFTYTSFNVTRNLHCWTLTGNFVPFGPYKSYNFRIGVNSSMLQDLKFEKQGNRGGYSNNVNWY